MRERAGAGEEPPEARAAERPGGRPNLPPNKSAPNLTPEPRCCSFFDGARKLPPNFKTPTDASFSPAATYQAASRSFSTLRNDRLFRSIRVGKNGPPDPGPPGPGEK